MSEMKYKRMEWGEYRLNVSINHLSLLDPFHFIRTITLQWNGKHSYRRGLHRRLAGKCVIPEVCLILHRLRGRQRALYLKKNARFWTGKNKNLLPTVTNSDHQITNWKPLTPEETVKIMRKIHWTLPSPYLQPRRNSNQIPPHHHHKRLHPKQSLPGQLEICRKHRYTEKTPRQTQKGSATTDPSQCCPFHPKLWQKLSTNNSAIILNTTS